jgi:hypothetical protein
MSAFNCKVCNTTRHWYWYTPSDKCDHCNIQYTIDLCGYCISRVSQIKPDIAEAKKLLNDKFCDPSKIIFDYWYDDIQGSIALCDREYRPIKNPDEFVFCNMCTKLKCINCSKNDCTLKV